jgi:hypothetical protein
MKLQSTIIALFIAFLGFSQDYSFEWGEQVKTKTKILGIYQINGNSFYAWTFDKGMYGRLLAYKNLTYSNTSYFRNLVDRKPTAYEGTFEIDGKIYTFTSLDSDDKTTTNLYAHEFKESTEKRDVEGKKVASYSSYKKKILYADYYKSDYKLILSEDKKKLCVTYYSPSEKRSDSKTGKFGYYILNSDLSIETEGSFDDILNEKGEKIIDYKLSNQGNLFLVTSFVVKDEPTTIKFYKVTGDEFNELEFNLGAKYASQLRIAVDKTGNFVVSGFYGERGIKGQTKVTGVRGVFFAIMNPTSDEILSSGFHEFDDQFIMEGLSKRQIEKTEKKKEEKGIEPSLYNFKMRSFESTIDGGYLGVAEEQYYVESTHTNPQTGGTYTSTTDYYMDLILFKLDKSGEIQWKKKVQKAQITKDGAFRSSFVMMQTDEKVYIIFNDNLKNYDPVTFKSLTGDIQHKMTFSNTEDAIAVVEVDIKNGKVERNALKGTNELGYTLYTKLSFPDKENSSILLYTKKGGKEMVGRMNFDK